MAADKLQLQVILSALDKATAPLKRIQGGSIGAGKALADTRDKIKQLNDIQRNISGFKTYQTELESTGNALQETRDKMGAVERALESHRTAQQALAGETNVHRRAVSNLQRELLRSKEPNAELSKQYMIAKDKLAQLETKYNASQNRMRRYKQDLGDTATAARTLNSKHQALSQQLADARTKLDAAGISTDKLAQHEHDLAGGLDKANAAMKVQKDRLAAITKQQESLGRARAQYSKTQQLAGSMAAGGAAGLASGYALARPLKGIVDAFAPAENATTQLKVSMMGSDGTVAADFQKISDLANNLGDRLPGTTADFQEMMTMLKRQGLSSANILGGTGEAAAYLAVQLQMPVTAAAEFAAKMQDATRTSEKDMLGLMDTIQRTYYLGVDSGNMLQGFSKISPVMGIIKKQGLEAANTLTPLLVMMDQTGMAGESAGNALRKVFQSGLNMDKVAKANKELKSLGIRMDFTDGKGEFGGMEKLFAQLEKLKGLTSVQRTSVMKELFGDDAETLQVVNTMMDKGMAGYQDIAAKMAAQADLRKRVNEQLKTLTNVMDAAQGSWSNTMSEIGLAIAPELKEFISSLGEVAVKVKGWVKANPELTAQIVKTAAGLAMLLAACGGLSLMIASIAGPVAIVRLGMVLLGIKSRGLISPLQGVGAATEGTVSKAGLLSKAWGGLAKMGAGLWSRLGLLAIRVGLLRDAFLRALPAMLGAARAFGAGLLQALWAGLKLILGGLGKFVWYLASRIPAALVMLGKALLWVGRLLLANPLGVAIAIIAGAAIYIWQNWDTLGPKFAALWESIKAGAGIAWEWIKTTALAVGQAVTDFFMKWTLAGVIYTHWDGIMAWMGGLADKFTTIGGQIIDGLIQGIQDKWQTLKATVTGLADMLPSWFSKPLEIHSPSRVFAGLGGFTMAGLAQGLAGGEGDVLKQIAGTAKRLTDSGAALFGIDGSGISVDNRAPISARSSASGPRSGDTYNFTINAAPGMDAAAIGREVQRQLAAAQHQQQARNRGRLSDQE